MNLNINKIEARRKSLKMNDQEFAKLLGVSKSYYCLIKHSKRKAISTSVVSKLYFNAHMNLKDIFKFD